MLLIFLPFTDYTCKLPASSSGTVTISHLEVMTTDSNTTFKWQHMGMNEHIQASILVGLLETQADNLKSASRYINEKSNPTEVTRTFLFWALTKKEHLHFPQFPNNINKTEGKAGDATHVVVGITYGAGAYCALSHKVQDDADEDDREKTFLLVCLARCSLRWNRNSKQPN